jgi:hypothetical protein
MSAVRQAASKLDRNIANKIRFLDVNGVKITKKSQTFIKDRNEITKRRLMSQTSGPVRFPVFGGGGGPLSIDRFCKH